MSITPGPWHYSGDCVETEGKSICVVCTDPISNCSEDVHRANVQAIAALPELLALTISLVANEFTWHTIQQAEAALQKAGVEPPWPYLSCPTCYKEYLACPTCGNCHGLYREGQPCKCGQPEGIAQKTESRFCCKRDWHHLGVLCRHCGTIG